MKAGIRLLRWITLAVVLWLVLEAARVYYFNLDIDRFMKVAEYLRGPWFAMFSVAAGGSHLKRWTESLKAKGEAAK